MYESSFDFVYVNYLSYVDLSKSLVSLNALLNSIDYASTINVFIVDNSFCITSPSIIHDILSLIQELSSKNIRYQYLPCDSNLGFGAGCNKASLLSSAENIIFINCDTFFEFTGPTDFLCMLRLLDDPKVAIVGPKVVNESGLLHSSSFSFDPISILLKPLRHVRKIGNITKQIPHFNFFRIV